jgi:integrase
MAELWDGGRVRRNRKDEEVWVIERTIKGIPYFITLNVTSRKQARAELALFERDPVSYQAALLAEPFAEVEGPQLRSTTLHEFLEDKRTGDKAVCGDHQGALERYLLHWMTALEGRDFRKITLGQYRTVLRTLKPRRQHIVAIRSFTHWLRKEGRLSATEDASQDLEVPQPKPLRAERAVGFTMKAVAKAYASIRSSTAHEYLDAATCQVVRDIIALKATTGMHLTEVGRIASGSWRVRRLEGYGEIAGAVTFFHKRGEPHSVSLNEKALAAAERLQKRGQLPNRKTLHRVLDACVKNADFNFAELRHSFATWANEFGVEVKPPERAGVSRNLIAQVMGHKNEGTTSGHYIDTEIPSMIALPLVLENPEDPIGTARGALSIVR